LVFVKALWELFLRSISTPLRLSFMIAFGILAAQIQVTQTLLQMDYRDVILGSYFLTSLAVIGVFLAVQVLRHGKRPRAYLAFAFLVICVVGISIFAWDAWHYVYNPVGVYEQRHWTKVHETNSGCVMSWKLVAALNKPAKVVFRVVTSPRVCPKATIQNLHPVVSGVDLDGAETGEQSGDGREFTFNEFRRPAELTFFLTLSNIDSSADPETCFQHMLRVTGDSAKGSGEKESGAKEKDE
jgi:hypothetical protein